MNENDRCRYPHCCCLESCLYGGAVPNADPAKPKFDRAHLRELADRHSLAIKLGTDHEFHISNDDMAAIAFALRFTAERL